MSYIPQIVHRLCSSFQQTGQCFYFFDSAGRYICSNHPDAYPEEAICTFFSMSFCPQDKDMPVPGTSYLIHICRINLVPAFYMVFPEKHAALWIPFIDEMLSLIQGEDLTAPDAYDRHLRMILTEQLANYSALTTEAESIIHRFGYSSQTFRAALLCNVPASENASPLSENNTGQPYDLFFSECAQGCKNSDPDDIFGTLTNNQFLIFKSVPSGSLLEYHSYVETFLNELSLLLKEYLPHPALFSVGSAYNSFEQLNLSYREASFLLANISLLRPSEKSPLFIQDFLMEYLTHTYLSSSSDIVFHDYNYFNKQWPLLNSMEAALSQNSFVLLKAGKQLDIHRNTMNQRYQKLISTVALDPVHHMNDRIITRMHLLSNVHNVSWTIGLHVQTNSVHYRICTKLAECLQRISHGSMELNIHQISETGNHQNLLHSIKNQEIDMGICGNSALYSVSPELASLIELPFIFDSAKQAQILINQIILPLLEDPLFHASVICPAFLITGSRHITSRDFPVRVPADLSGRTIRVINDGSLFQYFQQLDAKPMVIAYNEVYHALRNRIVDCQENIYANILGIGLYRAQQYINDMPYYYSISALLTSQKSWSELSFSQQSFMQEAITETSNWLINEQQTFNDRCCCILTQEKGMILFSPTEQERQLWLDAAQVAQAAHPLQVQLRSLLKAKETYYASNLTKPDL